jgi:bacillithiol system protein YtxJ
MSSPFIPIVEADALTQLVTDSAQTPVLLFKHDPFCGISTAAERELARLPGPVHVVDVARHRDLARQVTERTGVRHESPQVVVLRDGVAVWSASHRAIRTETVRQVLAAQTTAPPEPVRHEGAITEPIEGQPLDVGAARCPRPAPAARGRARHLAGHD